MNAYIKSIKKQRRAGLVRFVAGLGLVVAGCGVLLYLAEQIHKDGHKAGFVAGVAAVEQCEADGGSGYMWGSDGAFTCLYE